MLRASLVLVGALVLVVLPTRPVHAQEWPQIYDPLVLHTLFLEMSDADWQTIQNDETFDIEVPTLLSLDGEPPILVAIRRKSADPLNEAPGYSKVSYKIDINELVSGQNWHGLRAVSLDNGDDENVVSEGLAWYLHRVARGPEGYGYDAGMGSWVRLVINGIDTGVYVHAEQRDKRFLEHRGLWVDDETWLYEVEDLQGFELDEGGPADSPTFTALCYAPFASPSSCPTPDAATLAAQLPSLVDMKGLLALAAVDAFSANPDGIFSHGKNFYFADFLSGPRLHLPWDLDAALGGGSANADIYAPQSAYSQILLSVPEFRAQYSQILNDLVCGPLAESQLHEFLDALEPVLSSALAADPNSQIDEPVADFFDARRAWFSQRVASVTSQIEGFVPCSYDCSDGVDNDGDGMTDFAGGDPGCLSASDASEHAIGVACDDGADNDGDGFVDFGDDPGCRTLQAGNESPQCQDGLDNDGKPGIDFDGGASVNGGVPIAAPDPHCTSAWGNREAASCGIGFELSLLLPALAAWRRRSRAEAG